MAKTEQLLDASGTLVLKNLANQNVVIEWVNQNEVRIRKMPKKSAKTRLDDLVAGITDENRHGETDWGAPVGKEEW